MGIRAAWKGLWSRALPPQPEGKASAAGPLIVATAGVGQPRYTPVRYDRLAAEGFNANAVAYRCVTDIAQGIGSLSWTLRRRGATSFLDTHPLLTLLARPNPGSSGARLFEAVAAFYLLAGNSYLEGVAPASDAAPRELWPLRPDRMRVIPGSQGLPQGYEYEANGRKARWAADPIAGRSPILHLKSFHPTDDWYGLSRIEAAARAIDAHNESGAHNLALLQNGARPSGAVVFKPTDATGHPAQLSDAQRREIQEQLEDRFQGPRNAGRPLFLEGDFNWLEMGLSPKDMDFLQLKAMSAREIALAFGYPAYLLGLPEGATFSNVAEARLHLWEQTILPLAELLRDELANWLLPRFGDDLELDFDRDRISALSARRRQVWERVARADFLTLNERRARSAMGRSWSIRKNAARRKLRSPPWPAQAGSRSIRPNSRCSPPNSASRRPTCRDWRR
jgi:HK97 family phage portal protein